MKMAIKIARAHFALNFPKALALMFLMSAIVLAPNYPRIVVAFFVIMPITSLFGFIREHRTDDVFSALPVKRGDIINGQVLFAVCIEIIYISLMAVFAAVSAFIPFDGATIATTSVGMHCTPAFFGIVFFSYGIFNLVFLPIYFRGGKSSPSRALVSVIIAVVCSLLPYAGEEILAVVSPFFKDVFYSFGSSVIGWQLVILIMYALVFAAGSVYGAILAVKAYYK